MTAHRKDLHSVYQLARYQQKKLMLIAHLGGKCVVCNSTERLQFHHRDPSQKSFTILDRWDCSWETLRPELEKCELRCEEHHKEVHAPKHGTASMYKQKKCRCQPCVAANSAKAKTYREAKKKRDAAGPVTNGSFEVP